MTHPLVEAVGPVVAAAGGIIISADEAITGDIPLSWDGAVVAAVRFPVILLGALDRLIAAVECEFGCPLAELSREDKQRAVQLLDERGAFTLRKSVEDVADAMGVSRFTVYNYLNAR